MQFKIRIIPAIKEQLQRLRRPLAEDINTKRTFRTKRAQQKQQEDLVAVEKIFGKNETDL